MNSQNPKELVLELMNEYGLSQSNISVKQNGDLTFDLEGLQIMASQLCTDLSGDELQVRAFHSDQSYFFCDSILTLKDGLTVKRTGTAMMGEPLGGEDSIQNFQQAIDVASGRAYRKSLRAIGFEPVRAHRLKASSLQLVVETEEQRITKIRKQIHGIATDLGMIAGTDRSQYENTLAAMYDGRSSTNDLNETELQQFLTFLGAKQSARSRAIKARVESELKAA